MEYRIIVGQRARNDAEGIVSFIAGHSHAAACNWYEELMVHMVGLSRMPRRHAVAFDPELNDLAFVRWSLATTGFCLQWMTIVKRCKSFTFGMEPAEALRWMTCCSTTGFERQHQWRSFYCSGEPISRAWAPRRSIEMEGAGYSS